MKKRSLKQQLLLSVTALLLCVSMFVGSTFAWFTDSVTSTNNIIKSGNLDVSLEWLEGDEDPTSATAAWMDASKSEPIFNSKLWEPGYTAVRHIKIENEGSLALKYVLTITAYDGTTPVAPENVSKLADVIDVYYADPAQSVTRDTVETLHKLGSLREVLAGLESTANGTLKEKGASDVITLALKMREDANNDYQDLSIGDNFSITLFATQLEHEDDSFDNTYDEDALYGKTVEVNNKADLMTALANATADEPINVILASDVEYPTEGTHGLKDITPASAITIDGKGQYKLIATGSGVTPVGDSVAPLTLKNLTVVDNSVSYAEDSWEFTYLEFAGDLTFDNVVFESGISVDGDETNAVFNNCTFKTAEASVYAAWVSAGTVAFNDCTFTGTRGLKVHETYGTNVNTVLVDGCKFDSISKKPGIAFGGIHQKGETYDVNGSQYTDASNTVITVKNSTFINCQPGDNGLYTYESDTPVGAWLVMDNNNLATKAANDAALDEAIKNGDSTIYLGSGNYIIPDSAQGKTLTIVGNGDTVIATQDDGSYEGCDYSLDGSTVTFDGITINTDSRTYTGYARMSGTYNNCTINGAYTLYGESVFNNCTFNVTGDTYNIWTWGAKKIEFNGCTFNTDGKSILVYNQSCDVYVNDCTFNDRTNGTGFTKSALETGVDGVGPKYNIYIKNTTVNGFAENDKCVGYKNIVGNKNSMTNEYLNVVVDGVDVY